MLPVMWSKNMDDSNDIGSNRGNVKPVIYVDDRTFEADHLQHSYCFLKSCHLCHKPLKLHKDVYIYRGELGFCSDECRNRQIYLYDMKKTETATKRILASFRERRRGGGSRGRQCENSRLPEVAAPPFFKYLRIVDGRFWKN